LRRPCVGFCCWAMLVAGAGCRQRAEPAGNPPVVAAPAAQTPPAWIQDITEKVGINFVHDVGPIGTYFMPESVGSGTAIFDYDRDGWLDLIVVNYVDYSPTTKCLDPQGKPAYCGPSGFPGTVPRLFRNLGARGGGIRFEDVTVDAGLGKLAGPGLGVVCAD